MENFKQVAEDCLAGKLSGTFILRCGNTISSKELRRNCEVSVSYPYITRGDIYYTKEGNFYNSGSTSRFDIINFIPDMKKEQITINIPEGMKAVQETVDGEIRIKFVENKLTYDDVVNELPDNKLIYYNHCPKENEIHRTFYKKVEVLRKLTNIRNYFGKPKEGKSGWYINKNEQTTPYSPYETMLASELYKDFVVFDTKEHAEQAIKMLGDELKYLFEPW